MKFKPYKLKTIDKEFEALPSKDLANLASAMKSYEEGETTGYRLENYGDGIKMIKDSGRGQGRCLFFTEIDDNAIILKVYKKESQKIPKAIIDTAKQRKKKYEQ